MRRWITGFCIAAALTACGPSPAITQDSNPPENGATLQPTIPGQANVATQRPSQTQVELTPTATLMPTESLSTADLMMRLNPFSSLDTACQLPCYNRLTVGQGGLPEVMNFYANLGIGHPDMMPGDYDSVRDGEGHLRAFLNKASDQVQAEDSGLEPVLVDVGFAGGKAQYLYAGWQYLPDFLSVPEVFANLGEPDRLELGLQLTDQNQTYMLLLYFQAEQAGFVYYGNIKQSGNAIDICSDAESATVTLLGLFARDIPALEGLTSAETLLPLKDAVDMSFETLAAQLSAGNCLTLTDAQTTQWQNMQP